MIIRIPQLLTHEEVLEIRRLLQEASWSDGAPTAGPQAREVKHNEQLDHSTPQATTIRKMVLTALDRTPLFFSATLAKKVFPPRVNRYSGDLNHFGKHVDGSVRYMPGTGERVRSDVSCTVFFSDPESYEGGELSILDTYGEQSIKLAAGDMIIYPSTSVHEVKPVTKGERLACFFWIESMVSSDEKRRLLYDLDMNILGLRSQYGDNEHTVGLTSVYHNLIRMWAQT